MILNILWGTVLVVNLFSTQMVKGSKQPKVILLLFLYTSVIFNYTVFLLGSLSQKMCVFVKLVVLLTARDIFILYRRQVTRLPKKNKVGII
jgi:hypothetical protein